MTETRALELYHQHIRGLPATERLRLLALLASDLARQSESGSEEPEHDIMELDGLGKEVWAGIDAQDYVRRMRVGERLPS